MTLSAVSPARRNSQEFTKRGPVHGSTQNWNSTRTWWRSDLSCRRLGNFLSPNSSKFTEWSSTKRDYPACMTGCVRHESSTKESVHDGQLKADTLACRISAKRRDPDQQVSGPTEAVGHHVWRQSNEGYRHANATCLQCWQTSRNFATNGVMTHLRLLAQIRQPGPDLCADLSPATFRTFLVEVWSEDNFSMNRWVDGVTHTGPLWSHCLGYEFQIRSSARKLCGEARYPFQKALRMTYSNPDRTMKHWIQFLRRSSDSCQFFRADCLLFARISHHSKGSGATAGSHPS